MVGTVVVLQTDNVALAFTLINESPHDPALTEVCAWFCALQEAFRFRVLPGHMRGLHMMEVEPDRLSRGLAPTSCLPRPWEWLGCPVPDWARRHGLVGRSRRLWRPSPGVETHIEPRATTTCVGVTFAVPEECALRHRRELVPWAAFQKWRVPLRQAAHQAGVISFSL